MPRFPTLTHDELDALNEAHARLCTEWETIRIHIRRTLPKEEICRRCVPIIDECLDIINDLVRDKRRSGGQS